jgi:DNA-directed RNA polymerase specialized sigma24 family protein
LSERARARVRTHVARLPRKQREAVWLRWVEGQAYPVIAAKLGSSEESARANVYQGMKRLRTELFDLWEKEYGP